MNDYFGILTRRSVHPASPALLTKNGPLESITIFAGHFIELFKQMTFLTHLKFENKSRMFHSRKAPPVHCCSDGATSNHSLYQIKLFCSIVVLLILLSLGKLRKKPAIRRFDWSFAAIVKSYEQIAR